MQQRKSKILVFNLSLLIASSLVGFLILEGAIRLRQWTKYGTSNRYIGGTFEIKTDSELKVPIANSVTGHVRINSHGFRSPELQMTKRETDVRLAFLGASTTFCAEVSSNQHTWPHLVWRHLHEAYPDIKIDYINAGVPGYTTSESLRNLKYRVGSFNPDVIVIYHATNDLTLDSRELAQEKGVYQQWKKDWLSDISLSWYLIKMNLQIYMISRKKTRENKGLDFEPENLSKKFRKQLAELVEASKKIADIVAIPTFSYKMRREQNIEVKLKNSEVSIYYMPYMSVDGLFDGYEEYNRVIRDVAQEMGVILIDGNLDISGDDRYFSDSFHFTDAGSELMAKRVIEGLSQSQNFNAFLNSKRAR